MLRLSNDLLTMIALHCEDLQEYSRLRATCKKFRHALPDKAFVVRWIHENCRMFTNCECPNAKMFQCGIEHDDFYWDEWIVRCDMCASPMYPRRTPEAFFFAQDIFRMRFENQVQPYSCFHKLWDCEVCGGEEDEFTSKYFDDEYERQCCCILWWLISEKEADVNVVSEFINVLKLDFTYSVAWVLIELCLHKMGPSPVVDFLHQQADVLKPSKPKPVKFYKKPKKIRRFMQKDDEEWLPK